MGKWHTIHLFDYEKFKKNGFHDLMKNKDEFKIICQKFLKLTPFLEQGKSLPYEEKIKKIDGLYDRFNIILEKFTAELDLKIQLKEENVNSKKNYINSIFDFHFARFFNFLLFFKYADYYPFVIGGKHGIVQKFQPDNSLGIELLAKLDKGIGNSYFSIEGHGIVGWLTVEEVKLLKMDLSKLLPNQNAYITGFINLIRIAERENFGILLGVDMYDDGVFEKLPNKLKNIINIEESENEGLCFKR